MALLSWVDFEQQSNKSLEDPDGRALADSMAAAILTWSARYCNRLGWSYGVYTENLSPPRALATGYLSALPVDPSQPVTIGIYNFSTNLYDPFLGNFRVNPAGVLATNYYLPYGFESTRVTYTGGYTDNTFPADLKQALTDLLVQRFNNATSGGQTVSSVRAGDYSETYDLKGMDIPGDTMEVLDSYRLPVVY
jgi:hypothetical protein